MLSYDEIPWNKEKTRYDRNTLHVYVYHFFTGADPGFEELQGGFLYITKGTCMWGCQNEGIYLRQL